MQAYESPTESYYPGICWGMEIAVLQRTETFLLRSAVTEGLDSYALETLKRYLGAHQTISSQLQRQAHRSPGLECIVLCLTPRLR